MIDDAIMIRPTKYIKKFYHDKVTDIKKLSPTENKKEYIQILDNILYSLATDNYKVTIVSKMLRPKDIVIYTQERELELYSKEVQNGFAVFDPNHDELETLEDCVRSFTQYDKPLFVHESVIAELPRYFDFEENVERLILSSCTKYTDLLSVCEVVGETVQICPVVHRLGIPKALYMGQFTYTEDEIAFTQTGRELIFGTTNTGLIRRDSEMRALIELMACQIYKSELPHARSRNLNLNLSDIYDTLESLCKIYHQYHRYHDPEDYNPMEIKHRRAEWRSQIEDSVIADYHLKDFIE